MNKPQGFTLATMPAANAYPARRGRRFGERQLEGKGEANG
jgi:hypothetical protein